MNINRDNYEEYFLLYADNELTDSEKAEVLLFIRDNKDLEEEFRLIHHTISKPEMKMGLADKSFLLKNDPFAFINENNYEEIFVLYHDNELTSEQQKETEIFVSRHPQTKEAFELIGLAKLAAEESVVFPNKKILFKKERSGKVVPILFRRMLAAAILLGFGLWITYSYFATPGKTIATNVQPINYRQAVPSGPIQNIPGKKPAEAVAQQNPEKGSPKKEQSPLNTKKDIIIKNFVAKKSNKNPVENNVAIIPPVVQNINVTPVEKQQIRELSTEEVTALNKIETSKKASSTTPAYNLKEVPPAINVQTASYIQDDKPNNSNYVFYDVSSDEFKKTRTGGFLKKLKRIVERNNPITRLISGD